MLTSAAVIPRLSCLFYNVSTHSFRPYLANHPIFQKTEKKRHLFPVFPVRSDWSDFESSIWGRIQIQILILFLIPLVLSFPPITPGVLACRLWLSPIGAFSFLFPTKVFPQFANPDPELAFYKAPYRLSLPFYPIVLSPDCQIRTNRRFWKANEGPLSLCQKPRIDNSYYLIGYLRNYLLFFSLTHGSVLHIYSDNSDSDFELNLSQQMLIFLSFKQEIKKLTSLD